MADLEQSAEQLFGEALELQAERRAPFWIKHAGAHLGSVAWSRNYLGRGNE